jgi:hypothetical protein
MGNQFTKDLNKFKKDMANTLHDTIDAKYTANYMDDGGCGQQYLKAAFLCNPWRTEQRRKGGYPGVVSDMECARATEALLKCMKCSPEHFNGYISRIEGGLDQDQRPEKAPSKPPAPWNKRDLFPQGHRYNWWEGMRRS